MANSRLSFFGATGTVTGSRYMLQRGARRILIDCGLFQGLKNLRLRNWEPFPIAPGKIQSVLLTHAHLDHSGYLPKLRRDGFEGNIYATAATRDLADILLRDSASIMEEEAEHANRGGWSKHKPSKALYSVRDAESILRQIQAVDWQVPVKLGKDITATYYRAGHILGASSILIRMGGSRILFSGDLGRENDPILPDPDAPPEADYVVMESTYGNRLHDPVEPFDQLAEILQRVYRRGGSVLIPAFAVGRVQTLLWYLSQLKAQGRLPPFPIWVDSPMASRVTKLYEDHCDEHKMSREACRHVFDIAQITESHEESMRLQTAKNQRLILSASGMATGGRVLFHLENMLEDARNLVLFSGFQAAGTRGADLVGGAKQIKFHGRYLPVEAEIIGMHSQSAHADQAGLVKWLGGMKTPPKRVFLVHGEPQAADTLRRHIGDTLGWQVHVPEYREEIELASQERSKAV
jgi:metallo-beta-lactamase family protein